MFRKREEDELKIKNREREVQIYIMNPGHSLFRWKNNLSTRKGQEITKLQITYFTKEGREREIEEKQCALKICLVTYNFL